MSHPAIIEGRYDVKKVRATDLGLPAVEWLQEKARPGMTLLAHADDGVIWGRPTSDGFDLPESFGSIEQALLRNETLQMARLFEPDEEIFLWRISEGEWAARIVRDRLTIQETGKPVYYFDREQILSGTTVEKTVGDFRWLGEGAEGLYHAPPIQTNVSSWQSRHPLRLGIRHYLTEDEEGWRRIKFSRLTDLRINEQALSESKKAESGEIQSISATEELV